MLTLKPTGLDIGTTHEPGFFHEHDCNKDWLIMCFSTPFTYFCEDQMLGGEIGDCLINVPNEYIKHGPTANLPTGFVNDWIYIDGCEIGALMDELKLPVNTVIHTGNPKIMTPYLRTIISELLEKSNGYEKKISAVILDMLVELSRSANPQTTAKIRPPEAFDTLRNELLNSPGYHWTLSEMAQKTGYSVSRFCALYKQHFSISPQNDILNMRIMKAKNLLQHTDNSITHISEECGFSSVNHFSNSFKKATNLTPLQYRKR